MGWLGNWRNRVQCTTDSGDVTSILTDFPTLLYLSASSGRKSDDVTFIFDELALDANRTKIAVTTGDGVTQCYVEIEEWDTAGEEAWLHTKLPTVYSAHDTVCYLYFDRYQVANTGYVGDPNSVAAENVWDSDYRLVYHMRDDPNTSNVRDSTGYDNDGVKLHANQPIVTTSGYISDAQTFDGLDDKITPATSLSPITAVTLEAWLSIADKGGATPDSAPISRWSGGQGYMLHVEANGATKNIRMYIDNTTSLGTFASFNTYYHVVGTWDGSDIILYIDGSQVDTDSCGAINMPAIVLELSRYGNDDNRTFEGDIDEARISFSKREPSYVKASYESLRDHFIDYGIREGVPSAGYFSFYELEEDWDETLAMIRDYVAVKAGRFEPTEPIPPAAQ